jgi:hypothetical protein
MIYNERDMKIMKYNEKKYGKWYITKGAWKKMKYHNKRDMKKQYIMKKNMEKWYIM